MIKNRRASRAIFVQFLFSNLFETCELNQILDVLKNEDEEFYCNDQFLNDLHASYEKNSEEISHMIFVANNRGQNLDQLALAIITSAVTEMFINSPKVAMKEHLKISDMLEMDGSFINGVLNKIYLDFFPTDSVEPLS